MYILVIYKITINSIKFNNPWSHNSLVYSRERDFMLQVYTLVRNFPRSPAYFYHSYFIIYSINNHAANMNYLFLVLF